jgi:hypothetical protein
MARETNTIRDLVADPTSCREFRVSDAMILLAGVALALGSGSHLLLLLADMFGRFCLEAAAHREDLIGHWPAFWAATRDSLRNTLWYGFQVTVMFLLGMVPAFFLVRLRRPRPSLRALLTQPGTVAGLAMVFGLFWGTGGLLALFPETVDAMTAAPAAIGGAVAAAWGVLALSWQWKPERGWIDRIGRILGWFAIGNGLLVLVIHRI